MENIPIDRIKTKENIRIRIDSDDLKELMQSIRQKGLLHPIGIYKDNGGYFVAYGNRRLEAMRKLGYTHLRVGDEVKLLENMPTDEEFLSMNASENIHRKDITPAEFGRFCLLLKERGLSVGEIASRLNVPEPKIKTALELINRLPKSKLKDIAYIPRGGRKNGKVSATVASAILSFGLSREATGVLFDLAKSEDLTSFDMRIIKHLIRLGYPYEQAVRDRIAHQSKTAHFVLDRDLLKELEESEPNMTFYRYAVDVLNGKRKPIKNLVL